jgi:hypothetical protein
VHANCFATDHQMITAAKRHLTGHPSRADRQTWKLAAAASRPHRRFVPTTSLPGICHPPDEPGLGGATPATSL